MSHEIDILQIRSVLEENVRELTNGYTRLQVLHFEENQKLNTEVIKLTKNNKKLLEEIEVKDKEINDYSKKCAEYEKIINTQNEQILSLEEEEDNVQKVSIIKKQADEIERLENYVKILESQKEKKNIELNLEEPKEESNEESKTNNPKKRKKPEDKKEKEIVIWKLMIYNSYYKDPEKLLIARNEYAKHINKPLEEITDEVVGGTSAGINGWYEAGIEPQIDYIFGNITKVNKLIKADISLANMITDLLEIDINGENNTEQIIKFITNNKGKFIGLLVEDKAFLDMITDMIKNKEYEKFVKQDSDDEPEPEPEPESKTGVPEEYFKLETGQIVYSITSCTGDIKLFNSENDHYIGVKIGEYLEGDGQAKVKCFPYDIKQNKLTRSKSEEEILLTGDPVPSASDEEEDERKEEEKKEIIVFTDGACSNNGKPNAKAGIGIYFEKNYKPNVSKRIKGIQTNNIAELKAIIEVFNLCEEEIKNGETIKIYSDSQIAIGWCTTTGSKYEKQNWKKKKGDIPHLEYVKQGYELFKKYKNVSIEHIEAHSFNTDNLSVGNNEADKLATESLNLELEEEKKEEDEQTDTESSETEDSEEEEEIDMTKIKKMQYKKKDYFRIKDQDPAFIYENNNGTIGKKLGKIVMVGSKKKVEFF